MSYIIDALRRFESSAEFIEQSRILTPKKEDPKKQPEPSIFDTPEALAAYRAMQVRLDIENGR